MNRHAGSATPEETAAYRESRSLRRSPVTRPTSKKGSTTETANKPASSLFDSGVYPGKLLPVGLVVLPPPSHVGVIVHSLRLLRERRTLKPDPSHSGGTPHPRAESTRLALRALAHNALNCSVPSGSLFLVVGPRGISRQTSRRGHLFIQHLYYTVLYYMCLHIVIIFCASSSAKY